MFNLLCLLPKGAGALPTKKNKNRFSVRVLNDCRPLQNKNVI